ncbi:RHS repeat protein [Pseudidiomarina sp. 1APP75-27a]|uniref:RHS repeat domain-containing protein n=1 Tax=Pseudidiomarina terrestris TaxID=2820060 RepID=UPI00264BA196|nr:MULTISPECIES: RHS repeat domain-containing protein [unclassified Pseudidiomarina]MDN7137321.1 RHS repeat protein [Pseudidiomarina sp. 1ASP75-14]MEA3588614.1 RHS repeat protein [Pseudidiomarina sp. 1APP75-27a]
MNHRQQLLIFISLLFVSPAVVAQTTSSSIFNYDAKGRLVEVDNGTTFIEYAYDKAGNRIAVGNERLDQIMGPIITEFEVPMMASGLGDNTYVTWASTNTTSCAITFENQVNSYPDLPSSGYLYIRVFASGAVFLQCVDGSESAESSSYIFYQSGGGGPIGI